MIFKKRECVEYNPDNLYLSVPIFIKKKRSWKKTIKNTVIGIVICIFFSLLLIPPIVMEKILKAPVIFEEIYSPEDFNINATELNLTTSDKVDIEAYEVYIKSPYAVVVFLSDIQGPSVSAFYEQARVLKENGYGSILCEMRAHGKSGGDKICLGYKEYLDIEAVIDYIKSQSKYKNTPIVLCGASMGGAAAINASGEINGIDGLISIGTYSSWEDNFCDKISELGVPHFISNLEKPFIKAYLILKYGTSVNKVIPEKEIEKLKDIPTLLVHSKEDKEVPYSNFTRLMKKAPKHVEGVTKEGDLHLLTEDVIDKTIKDEYMDTIMEFLNKNFSN